jgi:hypothetical protein
MNTTASGSETNARRVPVKAIDLIPVSGSDLNEMDESGLNYEKYDEQRIVCRRES